MGEAVMLEAKESSVDCEAGDSVALRDLLTPMVWWPISGDRFSIEYFFSSTLRCKESFSSEGVRL